MLFSLTGIFVGALIVVSGFALRTNENRRESEVNQRIQLQIMLANTKKTEEPQ